MNGLLPRVVSMQRIVAALLVFAVIAPLVIACSGPPASNQAQVPATPTPGEPTAMPTTPAPTASPVATKVPAAAATPTQAVAPGSQSGDPPTQPTSTTTIPTPTASERSPASPTPRTDPSLEHVDSPDATATPTRAPEPSPTTSAPTPAPSPTTVVAEIPKSGRIFVGYYVPYDSTSWLSLEANADHLDYVAAQWTFVDACGNLTTQDNRTVHAFARDRGIGVLPSLFTVDGGVNHRVLNDEATATRAIHNLVDYVVDEGYVGLDVDLEGVLAEDRPSLTSFVQRLSAELRARGKLITMAVPAKASDVRTGWAGAYDYAALGPHVDLLTVMTYGYTIASSEPGSTAPYAWVDRVIRYVTSQVPKEKVLVGVPLWGYDWNVTTDANARALRYPDAEALARQYGAPIASDPESRSATFRYVARPGDPPAPSLRPPKLNHEISERKAPPCPVPTTPPRPTRPPMPSPTPAPEQQHEVWLEDVASFGARLGLAEQHEAGGIAVWRLGQEDPRVWERLAEWRTTPNK